MTYVRSTIVCIKQQRGEACIMLHPTPRVHLHNYLPFQLAALNVPISLLVQDAMVERVDSRTPICALIA
jgi:hypothetical protein